MCLFKSSSSGPRRLMERRAAPLCAPGCFFPGSPSRDLAAAIRGRTGGDRSAKSPEVATRTSADARRLAAFFGGEMGLVGWGSAFAVMRGGVLWVGKVFGEEIIERSLCRRCWGNCRVFM